ncbi:hypothetical protein MC378_03180 [Polaribacter sp. MSW13]|uniref:Lipoprotein n=1 Tax=Polaribacter marinus TaxID=2916838 RepID=A0A9X1VMM9_9FLAO|nr:hypothetical protein [Polaribacter marinus]MCI2228157.1 hypothetical protein [Polaribacter marinus]
MRKIIFFIAFLLIVIAACNQKTNKEDVKSDKKQETEKIVIDTVKTIVSKKEKTNIIKKENVIEVYHTFSSEKLTGDPVTIEMENTEGGMLSAYSFDTNKYKLFFREQIKGVWSDWKELNINTEVNNPKRKVYKATSVSNKSNSIQFKSSSSTDKEVVFRLYTFPKN